MEDALILLVEDNADDVALTMRALRKSSFNARVAVARDGVEALDFFFGNRNASNDRPELPELVILDLKLPKIDGLEVLRRLRSHHLTRCLPIVVLTTSNEKNDIVQCYDLGANSYIRKPVDFSRFNEVMRQIGQYWLWLNESFPGNGAAA